MARLNKAQLFGRVEDGIRESGWNLLYISSPGEHPGRYRVYRDSIAFSIYVYIWNISHGGGIERATNEFRIQVTGVPGNTFLSSPGSKTLILGWWPNHEILAGFDYRRHRTQLGSSSSFQVGRDALQDAVTNRVGTHRKSTGELVITFQPEFIGTYAQNLEALHDTGQVTEEVDLLNRIAAASEVVAQDEITGHVGQPRRYAVTQTRRALRSIDFRARVLSAYEHRCAMCGVQLKLVEGAHILPVQQPDSTDDTSNGIALCALHHRAYDRSLVTFQANYEIRISESTVSELREAELVDGLQGFREHLRDIIILPAEHRSRPNTTFVELANRLRGWM